MSPMRFRNYGDIYQFEIRDEHDLARIEDLDPARWAATSAPLQDLHCDAQFLKYLDPGDSGRVRVGQLIAARDWTFARLARKDLLAERKEVLPLDAMVSSDVGKKLRAAAERVNKEQGAADTHKVSLADVRAFKGGYQKLLANGDGVIPPDLLPEAEVAAFVKDAMLVVGSTPDRGGAEGLDGDRLEKFKTQGAAWLAWRAGAKDAEVWGADTEAAWTMVQGLDAKIEAYFLQCELVRQESATADNLKLADEELRALRQKAKADIEKHLSDAPLAAPDARGLLALHGPINVVFVDAFSALRDKVLVRVLGESVKELDRSAWHKVKAVFDPYVAWKKAMPPEPFEKLGEDKLRGYLDGPLTAQAAAHIAADKAAQAEIDQVDDLEKLVLCVRWLVELGNNFVNFSAIYQADKTALVEMGSLVIDGRRLDFCLKVANRAAHKPVASESLCFLVYAKISAKEGGPVAYEVVAPVTGGEKGRLRVGKRGIFLDNDNKEWDAELVEIVENPISVKEAALAPFRRASKFVGDKIEEWVGSQAASQDAALQASTAQAVTAAQARADAAAAGRPAAAGAPAAAAPAAAAPAAAAPAREGLNPNTLILGGGVALAGLGAVFASLFSALTSVRGWLGISGLVLSVLAVSALAGWLKLRRRDMSLLLEASGWAVNLQMKITRRVAPLFAYTPALPKDALIDRTDVLPAVPGEGRGKRIAILFVLLGAALGLLWVMLRRGMLRM
jgi:hypothetical protein